MLPSPLGEKHLHFVNSKWQFFILKFRQMISVARHQVHREKIRIHDCCRFLTRAPPPPPQKKKKKKKKKTKKNKQKKKKHCNVSYHI